MLLIHVEDNPGDQELLKLAVHHCGFEIVTFDLGVNAMNFIENIEPDLMLIDLKLFGGKGSNSGLKLLSKVRELYPACAVLMISAFAQPQDVRQAFLNGIDDFLFKPVEIN